MPVVNTIADLFYQACARELPDALLYKKEGAFVPLSHGEIRTQVERLVLAMEARGLLAGDQVGILSENRPEWAMTDYACAILGATSVPVYPTLNSPQTAYILRDACCRWLVCSNPAQAMKLTENRAEAPTVETVLLMEGNLTAEGLEVVTWAQLQKEGRALDARRPTVRDRANARKPGDRLTIIYTSGTTGEPKGAVLTHGNVVSNILRCMELLPKQSNDRGLSFLPLSHIFERMAGHYSLFHMGTRIAYAESINTLGSDLLQVKPTILIAVPRIFEKIYAGVRDSVEASFIVKRLLFRWAMAAGRRALPFLYEDKPVPGWIQFQLRIAKAVVFSKILARTGGCLRFAVSGGAPLSSTVMEFLWCIGIPTLEGYGLTETSPVLAANRFGEIAPGTVGRPIFETWEGKPFLILAKDGEILTRGPGNMTGYWRNEKATAETVDAEGYLHTGDVGSFDEKGRLKITDRKKELIITSGGKNIAPQPIEEMLKGDKYISQAVLIGDRRNYITALIVPNFSTLRRWAGMKKIQVDDDSDMVRREEVYAKCMQRVARVNAQLSKFEQIKRITILDHEFTVERGQLTPSLKIKRRVINEMYKDHIEAMYTGQVP